MSERLEKMFMDFFHLVHGSMIENIFFIKMWMLRSHNYIFNSNKNSGVCEKSMKFCYISIGSIAHNSRTPV